MGPPDVEPVDVKLGTEAPRDEDEGSSGGRGRASVGTWLDDRGTALVLASKRGRFRGSK